jgi:hypothetical protein
LLFWWWLSAEVFPFRHSVAALSLEELLVVESKHPTDSNNNNNNNTHHSRRPRQPRPTTITAPTQDDDDSQSIQQAIDAAKADIQALIRQNLRLAPKFIRLGFHDCVGGCDGCVDLNDSHNNGLDIPIDALQEVVNQHKSSRALSRADIWALAALTAAEMTAQPPRTFPLAAIGRIDCEDFHRMARTRCRDGGGNVATCDAKRGPHRELPSSDLDTRGVLSYFWKEFQFAPDEVVALMGAHSIGFAERNHSGFAGHDGWTPQSLALNHDFYVSLVAATWHQIPIDNSQLVDIPDRFQWVRVTDNDNRKRRRVLRGGGQQEQPILNNNNNTREGPQFLDDDDDGRGEDIFMLNADVALVRDFRNHIDLRTGQVTCDYQPQSSTSCPFAATFHVARHYMRDEQAWMNDFVDVYDRMLTHGYVLRDERTCRTPPCRLKKK